MTATDSVARLRAQFEERSASAAKREPGWLSRSRSRAFERFAEKGFPTTRDEDWRFTSLRALRDRDFELDARDGSGDAQAVRTGPVGDAEALRAGLGLSAAGWHELVFIDGVFSEELSALGTIPGGVVVSSLSGVIASEAERVQALLGEPGESDTAFSHLNQALFSGGAYVHVSKNVAVEMPVHFVYLTTASAPLAIHPRNLVHVESSSQLSIVETYAGLPERGYWTNAVTQIVAGDGAVVDHYKLQLEGTGAFHVASVGLRQGRAATASSHSLSLGAALARHDIRADLEGEGADVTLNGLYVVKGAQHVDHHTVIDHRLPHGTSRELFKGVLDDRSSGVFNGRIIVRQDAQKTDSQQSNKNLLLSEHALVNSNPQLEINADDVKCAHGATIGQLDENMLFYLRSRGIGLERARTILTEGFMADVSDRIRVAPVKQTLGKLLFARPAA